MPNWTVENLEIFETLQIEAPIEYPVDEDELEFIYENSLINCLDACHDPM